MPTKGKPIKVFISYAPADQEYLVELEKHLSLLQREGVIETWHSRKVGLGEDWRGKIDAELEDARLMLLLVSADFIASDYCYDVELRRALERHRKGDARVIPVLLRPCDWESAPFGKLQVLPEGALPVNRWTDRDEAFTSLAKAVRRLAETHFKERRATSGPLRLSKSSRSLQTAGAVPPPTHTDNVAPISSNADVEPPRLVDKILDRQFEQLSQLVALFEGKTELDLRDDAGLLETLTINWLRIVDDYALSAFSMVPQNADQRPYRRVRQRLVTADGLRKHYRRVDSHVRSDKLDADTTSEPTGSERGVPWSEYEVYEICIHDRLESCRGRLAKLTESAFLPSECVLLVKKYIDVLDSNVDEIGTLLREAAVEFPSVYPTFDMLRCATPDAVLARFNARVHHLKEPADAVIAFVRKFLTVDAVIRAQ